MKQTQYNKARAYTIFIVLFFLFPTTTIAFENQPANPIISGPVESQILDTHISPYPPPPDIMYLNYSYSFPQPEITPIIIQDITYHRVVIEGLPTVGDINAPCLPVKPVSILLPQCFVYDSVTVTGDGNVSLGQGYNPELGQIPLPTGDNPEILSSEFIPPIQASYPSEVVQILNTYDFRGYSILTFCVYPIHFIAESGELYYYPDIDVAIRAIETGSVNRFFRGLPEDEMMMHQLVDDYTIQESYDQLPYYGKPYFPPGDYQYVIITNNALKNAHGAYTFQDLVEYKTERGTPTTIMTVEDIYAQYSGVDNQEKIRKFIQDAYHFWHTNYVLLGGDIDVVPTRNLFDASFEVDFIASDLYFACLDGDFNRDGDNVYGELGDLVDFRAEVYVGRACVETSEEVSYFVEKTLAYIDSETTTDYLKKVLMVGEKLDNFPSWGGDSMDEMIDGSFSSGYYSTGIPSNVYMIDTLYDRNWPGNNWPKEELIDEINSGVHIINHLGHGNNFHVMKLDEPVIMRNGQIIGECHDVVENLTNNDYFFVYSQACFSGAFDNRDSNNIQHPYDCIGEYLTVKTSHGAFAGILNTRYGFGFSGRTGGPSQVFHRLFWHAIYGASTEHSLLKELGPANHYSKEINLWRLVLPGIGAYYRLCYFEITLFGDPQITIKTPTEPEPEWVSPTGHYDPESAWDNEPLSYDSDINTKAGCTLTEFLWTWTPFLELHLPASIPCNKIRFWAWFDWLHCDTIDVDLFYGGAWHNLLQRNFIDRDWDDESFAQQMVSKARVRFHVQRWVLWPVTADLHEFQFCEVP